MTNYEKATSAIRHVGIANHAEIYALLAVIDELRGLREWLTASYPTFSVQRVSGSTPTPREWLGVAYSETTDGLPHDAP